MIRIFGVFLLVTGVFAWTDRQVDWKVVTTWNSNEMSKLYRLTALNDVTVLVNSFSDTRIYFYDSPDDVSNWLYSVTIKKKSDNSWYVSTRDQEYYVLENTSFPLLTVDQYPHLRIKLENGMDNSTDVDIESVMFDYGNVTKFNLKLENIQNIQYFGFRALDKEEQFTSWIVQGLTPLNYGRWLHHDYVRDEHLLNVGNNIINYYLCRNITYEQSSDFYTRLNMYYYKSDPAECDQIFVNNIDQGFNMIVYWDSLTTGYLPNNTVVVGASPEGIPLIPCSAQVGSNMSYGLYDPVSGFCRVQSKKPYDTPVSKDFEVLVRS